MVPKFLYECWLSRDGQLNVSEIPEFQPGSPEFEADLHRLGSRTSRILHTLLLRPFRAVPSSFALVRAPQRGSNSTSSVQA